MSRRSLDVTEEQIAAAQLRIVLDEKLGRRTSNVVRRIAGMTGVDAIQDKFTSTSVSSSKTRAPMSELESDLAPHQEQSHEEPASMKLQKRRMAARMTVTDLVEAAANGEQEAWNSLVDQFMPLVRSVTRTYRLTDRDAEYVSQTVWLRLVEHLSDIREPRALPKWIMTTAKNESLRLIKTHRRMVPFDQLGDSTTAAGPDSEEVETNLLRAEPHQALRDSLAELAPRQRELLLLLVADSPISYSEISRLLEMPVGSIGPTRARALDRLRGTLTIRGELASWRDKAGDPTGAVTALEQLLTDQLRILGPDHPDTLTIRGELASWRGKAGDPTGAVTAFEQLLTDQLRILGPDHPDTLTIRGELASWRSKASDQMGSH